MGTTSVLWRRILLGFSRILLRFWILLRWGHSHRILLRWGCSRSKLLRGDSILALLKLSPLHIRIGSGISRSIGAVLLHQKWSKGDQCHLMYIVIMNARADIELR